MGNQLQLPNNFQLSFSRIPNCIISLQKCSVPAVQSTHVEVSTPFSNLKFPGTNQTYTPFNIQFKLDENFAAYIEIFNWMQGLGFPDDFTQFSNLKAADKNKKVVSDATLIALSANSSGSLRFNFSNMFPVYISEIEFDTTITEPQYIDIQVSFMYDFFHIEKL